MYFCIVSPEDIPLFEYEFGGNPGKKDLNQFIAHAALDLVDVQMPKTNNMFLRQVDSFNEVSVWAFVTAARTRFILLEEKKMEENHIRLFLSQVYEMYVKIAMNPFFSPDRPILVPEFGKRVHGLANRHLSRK